MNNDTILRQALLDVIDVHHYRLYEGEEKPPYIEVSVSRADPGITEDYANQERLRLCDAVIERVRKLKHDANIHNPEAVALDEVDWGPPDIMPGYLTSSPPPPARKGGITAGPTPWTAAQATRYAFTCHLEAADAWEKAGQTRREDYPHGLRIPQEYRVLLRAAETATGRANDATGAAPANASAFGASTDALLNASIGQHALAAQAHLRAADAYAALLEEYRILVKGMALDVALEGLLAKVGIVQGSPPGQVISVRGGTKAVISEQTQRRIEEGLHKYLGGEEEVQ